jgi:hypothetical protein
LTKLESLYNHAIKNNIEIINPHFSSTKKSAYIYDNGYKNILLDKSQIDSSEEELMLLAEEIGHYETGSFCFIEATYNTDLERLNRSKGKALAKRWAIEKIIPPEKINKAIKNMCYEDYEIAEFCGVRLDYLREALRIYMSQGIRFG